VTVSEWQFIAADLRAENQRLREVLERIALNGEAWHGPEPDPGHVRALKVIAATARDVLAGAPPKVRRSWDQTENPSQSSGGPV
jgi:hypothetical protein